MTIRYYRNGSSYIAVWKRPSPERAMLGFGHSSLDAVELFAPTSLDADLSEIALLHGALSHTGENPEDWEDCTDEVLDDAIEAVVIAAEHGMRSWSGWDWPHDAGRHSIVKTGPGALEDWDSWQATQRAELNQHVRFDLDDEVEDRTQAEIAESLDMSARAERDFGERCQQDAEKAALHARDAIQAANAGSWRLALAEAKQAAKLEQEYREETSYRLLVEACARALLLAEGTRPGAALRPVETYDAETT